MSKVQLDLQRLFGFKIIVTDLAKRSAAPEMQAKIGAKPGDKNTGPVRVSIGSKIGDKAGQKAGGRAG